MKTTSTRNYDMFVSDKFNRIITQKDDRRLKRLRFSMKKYGFLPFPILVRRNGEKLIVIDGQHRLKVAQELGLPVLYIEAERDDIEISECAAAQSPWSTSDYVLSHAAQGKKDYQDLLEFAAEHSMPLNQAASLLRGDGSHAGNYYESVKQGSFVVRDRAYADRVARISGILASLVPWGNCNWSIGAISRFVRVKEFNDDQFIKRVKANHHLLVKQPTLEAYSEMYDAVYNYKSHTRIPLAFLAKESATERQDFSAQRRKASSKAK
jgi:hypothetical protein